MVTSIDIRSEILRQTGERVSVAPRDVAQVLTRDGEDWRKLLPKIRAEAISLHGENQLVFIRKKKIVSPEGLKGVYRLGRPAADDGSGQP
ncbi:MAG: DUF3253 domain-containing protein [Kordiimonas sp.]